MAGVTLQLGQVSLVDVPTVAIALAAAVLLVRYKVNSAWLVLGGALVGVIAAAAGAGVVAGCARAVDAVAGASVPSASVSAPLARGTRWDVAIDPPRRPVPARARARPRGP
jgi:hypothetical protein